MIKNTALALAALAAGASVQAQDAAALSVTVDVSYVSDYVFRGQLLANDSVQPSVEATYGDFYAGVWHSNEVNGTTGSETDVYAGYGFALNETISLDAGVTRYLYNGQSAGDTTEVYVGASADVLLSPSLYYYYDFDREASTVELSIGYSLPLDVINASLDLSAKAGFTNKQPTAAGQINDDYTYYVVGAAVPYKLSETATFTVGVDYVYNDTASATGFPRGDSGRFVGKAGVSIGF